MRQLVAATTWHTSAVVCTNTKGTFTHAWSGRGRWRAENWLQHRSFRAFTHTQSWSGSKIRSATNGSNTQFSTSISKPRTPNHLCPQQIADPLASTLRMCKHTRGSGAWMSKSAVSAPQPLRAYVNVSYQENETVTCINPTMSNCHTKLSSLATPLRSWSIHRNRQNNLSSWCHKS